MEKKQDNLTIYGTHYHCKKCKCEMIPKARIDWDTNIGIQCIHVCPRCTGIFIEKEYNSIW